MIRRDGFYSVYYLPEEHYVGYTNRFKQRLAEHRSKKNRITEGATVIAKFESADAHLFETRLHQRGYLGFNQKKL